MDKNELRCYAKNIRKDLDIDELSTYFVNRIRNLSIYKNSTDIMLYYPINTEINLCKLTDDVGKNFYLPKICQNNLDVCLWNPEQKLCLSVCKTFEPCTKPVNPQKIDLVIVPALMVDKKGYRLGYGGGFYDRFIDSFGQYFHTLSVIPKELYIENLPVESHDKKIDTVIVG